MKRTQVEHKTGKAKLPALNGPKPTKPAPPDISPIALALSTIQVQVPSGELIPLDQLDRIDFERMVSWVPVPEARGFIKQLGAGMGVAEAGKEPKWAQEAARQFLVSLISAETANVPSDDYRVGYYLGVGQALLGKDEVRSALGAFSDFLMQLLPLVRIAAANAKPEQAAAFFEGQLDGEKRFHDEPILTQRAIQYAVVACAWRKFAGLSMGAVHRKFIQDGLLTAQTDSRQTRELLASIGFPAAHAGRPKKKEE